MNKDLDVICLKVIFNIMPCKKVAKKSSGEGEKKRLKDSHVEHHSHCWRFIQNTYSDWVWFWWDGLNCFSAMPNQFSNSRSISAESSNAEDRWRGLREGNFSWSLTLVMWLGTAVRESQTLRTELFISL